jgi:hypothetical protein
LRHHWLTRLPNGSASVRFLECQGCEQGEVMRSEVSQINGLHIQRENNEEGTRDIHIFPREQHPD